MKTDPHRVARILKDAYAIWQERQRFSQPWQYQLSSFCFHNKFNYKLVSKWMTKGLRYVHPASEGELRRLCETFDVKYEDLWDVPTVSLSVDEVAEAIRLLSELQSVLQKGLDRVNRTLPRGKPPA